jgi:uncharacterized protein
VTLMKVAGEATARGTAETVWDALHDAAVLARAIPGCERFEVAGPGAGEFTATTALPAIGGTYAGKLAVTERQRPSLVRLTASAAGDQGTVTADLTVRLSETAGAGPGATTLISYQANGTVAGSAAGIGTRLLASAGRRLAEEFFAAIGESVAAHGATSAPAASPETAEPAVAEPAVAEPAAARPGALASAGRLADNRVVLVAGAAVVALAGFIIGARAGRRRAGRVRA